MLLTENEISRQIVKVCYLCAFVPLREKTLCHPPPTGATLSGMMISSRKAAETQSYGFMVLTENEISRQIVDTAY